MMFHNQDKDIHLGSTPEGKLNAQLDVPTHTKKANGVVYTPKVLANYVAQKVTTLYLDDHDGQPRGDAALILDPACGKGELLESMWHSMANSDLPSSSLANSKLLGIDIDEHALEFAENRIRALSSNRARMVPRIECFNTNSLFPFNSPTSQQGWAKLRRRVNATSGFDIIIANPPWGADISSYRQRLSKSEFTLFRGQFDSSDLFLESAIANLRVGGYLAFIVPDSLFSQERKQLRKLLLHQTEIRFIGRLGENFFDNVSRACAVLICKKNTNADNQKIQCLRLTQQSRKKILAGELEMALAEQQLSNYIESSRFRMNRAYQFNIDLRPNEEKIIQAFSSVDSTLRDQLVGTRGVELSKKGNVYQCSQCDMWSPYPTSKMTTCSHCGTCLSRDAVPPECVISKTRQPNYSPILVGESISRYAVSKPYWIDPTKHGISYKDASIYLPAKLLVRKTGVGISVAIDYSSALTNQVVYIFRTNRQNAIALEFYLGLLASRAVYFYIAKTYGETEWRSHPYLTQKQILEIPVPPLDKLSSEHERQVNTIVRTIRKYKNSTSLPSLDDEAIIERMVANIYGLTPLDYQAIFRSIYDAQDLVPIRALKTINVGDVFPIEHS